MKVSNWSDGSAPILLDPTTIELVHFAENEHIDTLRLCADETHIGIASGFGNTHSSVITAGRKFWPKWFPYSCILYRDGNNWLWNLLDQGGKERVEWKRGLSCIEPKLAEAVEVIVQILSQR